MYLTYFRDCFTARVFVFVDEEELFSVMKDLDCLYCRIPVTATKHHLKKKHLRFAIYYKDSGIGNWPVTVSTIHTNSVSHPFSTLMLSVVDREVFDPLLLFWWRTWQEPLALPNVLKNIAQDTELQNPYYQPRFVSIKIHCMVLEEWSFKENGISNLYRAV